MKGWLNVLVYKLIDSIKWYISYHYYTGVNIILLQWNRIHYRIAIHLR